MTTERTSPISIEELIDLEITRHLRLEADGLAVDASEALDKVIQPDVTLSSSQIHGLLNRANTARDTSQVETYVKGQSSKPTSSWKQIGMDNVILPKVNADLRARAMVIANQIKASLESRRDLSAEDQKAVGALTTRNGRWQEIHLSLTKRFIQAFAVGYLYRTADGSRGGGAGDDTP